MIENGYIRLHRTLTGWRWYKDGNVLRLWLHLLLNANYAPSDFQDRVIGRGEQVTSLKALSDDTGLSVKEVRTAMDKLKRTGEITTYSNRRFTIVSIPNYDKFQSDSDFCDLSSGTQSANQRQTNGKQAANQRQTNGILRATSEKEKKAKNTIPPCIPPTSSAEEIPFSGALGDAVRDWLAYKTERRESYKPTGLKSLFSQIERTVKVHGEDAVCDCIRLSMSNGWRGIIWDRIEKEVKPDGRKPEKNFGRLEEWL